MIPLFARQIRERMDALTSSLTTLRDRIRYAVAGEMSKVIAEALRDLLQAILVRDANQITMPAYSVPAVSPTSRWDDDEDGTLWHEPPRPSPVPSAPFAATPVQALHAGVSFTTWLLHRQVPLVAGLGLGLLAGFATLSAHPLVQTCIAVATAAAELLTITQP